MREFDADTANLGQFTRWMPTGTLIVSQIGGRSKRIVQFQVKAEPGMMLEK